MDDKWKVIDKHLSSMMDWAGNSNLSSSPVNQNASGNSRQGHTHRRSEPDVVMIRKALPSLLPSTNNVPQSAPVQPANFTLDWTATNESKISQLQTLTQPLSMECTNVNHENLPLSFAGSKPILASKIHENKLNGNINQFDDRSLNETPNLGEVEHNGFVSVPNKSSHIFESRDTAIQSSIMRVPPPYRSDHTGTISAPGSGNSSPFLMRANSPSQKKNFMPQTYIGSQSPLSAIPINQTSNRPHSNRVMFSPSIKTQAQFQSSNSPKTMRRSSAPGNQDPRSHSASPNMARRSTSHSSAMLPSRAQDNYHPRSMSIDQNSNNIDTTTDLMSSLEPILSGNENMAPLLPSVISIKSTNDDSEYTKVLLQHQQERMERLRKELYSKKELLNSLTKSVADMERKVFQQRNEKTTTYSTTSMPTLQDITKLREVNRQMEIDCNCMIKEVDMLSKNDNSMNRNFHDSIRKRNAAPSHKKPSDLPSPPLPPPPIPPPVESEDEQKWSCNYCTFLNHAALNKCEICEYRREVRSARSHSP